MEAKGDGHVAEILHVFDFPQLYTKPTAQSLLNTLTLLTSAPPSWECSDSEEDYDISVGLNKRRASAATKPRPVQINPEGLTRYLTSIIGNDLGWIYDDNMKEDIWEEASLRLSERSGRSAMPAMSREFRVPTKSGRVDITIHEPALTEDNIGLKTWAASYMLSKRLHTIKLPQSKDKAPPRMLELGSGTGLVGIAAAAVFGSSVLLTDLAEITPNLAGNIEDNRAAIEQCGGSMDCAVLNWAEPFTCQSYLRGLGQIEDARNATYNGSSPKYPVILAADSLYSPEHPRLLVQTIDAWLSHESTARVIVEFPFRDAYVPELGDFKTRMASIGLCVLEEGEESGYDDWASEGGRSEVRCWWSIWGRIPESGR
ncbi:hypothetical protein BU16DRAFT_540342 [Lophium mytilinum]|uniref:Glucose-inducible SAM-dependent methyltransferase Rrg1 n=1 Tax=Lophium mytilinum TaxID=390894 RepID=A0A6A6QN25_9PEZI|nr:hypothetical protein BU16DRAFT_540342 [Lophium mytilinum]